MNRTDRFEFGRLAEIAVIDYLESCNKSPVLCGQEIWLPDWAHERLRTIHNVPEIDALRHFPDIATSKALIQVKSAPDYNGHPYLTIEQASYRISKLLCDAGVPVIIMWYLSINDSRFILWNFADKLNPVEPEQDRHAANGSMTPMYFIKVGELKRIELP